MVWPPALGLLKYLLEGSVQIWPRFNPTLATGFAAPVVIFLVWRFLRRIRLGIIGAHDDHGRQG